MGWRFHRRIGKVNVSKSGLSLTQRWSEKLTTNFSKRGRRTTLNLGNGFSYVWYTPNKRKKEAPKKFSWVKILLYMSIIALTLYIL